MLQIRTTSMMVIEMLMSFQTCPVSAQETIFAVVTSVSKDKRQAGAQVSIDGIVSAATLMPTDDVLDNLIWRKLEICHSLKVEGLKVGEGYRITSVKVLD